MSPRNVMRLPAVKQATGLATSTIYKKIALGIFPRGEKLDPNSPVRTWFEDEIAAYQKAAVEKAVA